MRRFVWLVTALAVGLAACGGGTAGPVAPRFLAYEVEPGTSLTYRTDLALRFTMQADLGDAADPVGDLSDTSMELEMTGSVVYGYGPGPEAGTYTVDITQVPGTIERVMMDVMGERLEFEDAAAINSVIPEIPPVTYQVVVDELGNLVAAGEVGSPVAVDSLGFAGGGLSGSPSASQLLGPAFSPEAVAPGDEWSWERWDAVPGTDDVRTSGRFEYLRDETIDGIETVVIAYTTETDGFVLDAAAMADLAAGGDDLGVSAEELAAMASSGFSIAVDGIVVSGTVFFDPADGVVVRQDSTTSLTLAISTPELMGAAVTQTIEVDMRMRRVG